MHPKYRIDVSKVFYNVVVKPTDRIGTYFHSPVIPRFNELIKYSGITYLIVSITHCYDSIESYSATVELRAIENDY